MMEKHSDAQHDSSVELYLAAAAILVILSGWPAWELIPRLIFTTCLAAAVVAKPRILERSLLWFTFAAAFVVWIAINPLQVGNHQFVSVYLCLATGLVLFHRAPEWRTQWALNARWLLVGLMAFATVQKLFSPEYMRGEFWGYFCSFGLAGKFVFSTGIWDPTVGVFQENRETLTNLAANRLGDEVSATVVRPFAYFNMIVIVLTWATLVAEALIAITYAIVPRAVWTHTFLLAFVGMLLLIRPEVEFASLVLVMGRISAGELPHAVKFGYNVGIALCLVLSLALHHVDLGVLA